MNYADLAGRSQTLGGATPRSSRTGPTTSLVTLLSLLVPPAPCSFDRMLTRGDTTKRGGAGGRSGRVKGTTRREEEEEAAGFEPGLPEGREVRTREQENGEPTDRPRLMSVRTRTEGCDLRGSLI